MGMPSGDDLLMGSSSLCSNDTPFAEPTTSALDNDMVCAKMQSAHSSQPIMFQGLSAYDDVGMSSLMNDSMAPLMDNEFYKTSQPSTSSNLVANHFDTPFPSVTNEFGNEFAEGFDVSEVLRIYTCLLL